MSDDLAGPEGAENGVSWSRFHSTVRFLMLDVKEMKLDGAWSMLDNAQTAHLENVIYDHRHSSPKISSTDPWPHMSQHEAPGENEKEMSHEVRVVITFALAIRPGLRGTKSSLKIKKQTSKALGLDSQP